MMRVFVIATILLASVARADNPLDGGQAAAFLKMGVGARAAGMGSAQTAVCDDAYGAFYNPAGMIQLEHLEAGSQTALLPSGRTLNFLSAIRPLRANNETSFAYGISWTNFFFNNPLERRVKDSPDPEGTFQDSENAVLLSGAGWINPGSLALGASFKLIQQSLGDASAIGYSGDLGMLFKAAPEWTLGLVVLDPFASVDWSTGAYDNMPLTFRAGGAWRPAWALGLLASAEIEKSTSQGFKPRLGLEWWPKGKIFALRAGDDNGAPCLGLGLRLEFGRWWAGELDYAVALDRSEDFTLNDPALMDHRISLTVEYELTPRPEGPRGSVP